MILRTKWVCPNCTELSPTRHWSVQRHIQRKHDGVGEPISVNTYQTRAQMQAASGISNFYAIPRGNPTRPYSRTDSFSNSFVYQKNPIRSLGYQSIMPIPQWARSNDSLVSKVQEIIRLGQQPPEVISNFLDDLALRIINDVEYESFIDEILENLRNKAKKSF